MPELVVIGGGRMGTALVRGLQRAGWKSDSLAIVEKADSRRSELECELPGVIVSGVRVEAASVVIAVKPADAEGACRGYVGTTAERVLSIMAGVTTARIDTWLGGRAAVIRAMPNTPALVGAGVSAVAPGPRTTGEDLAWAESVLGSVGTVVRVEESDLDVVTGLSGSGPAYVFLLVEELARAGIKAGLDPATSAILARQTVAGAGRLLDESPDDPSELRRQVTSPGGTTEAGLAVLTGRGMGRIFEEAVLAAAERSRELGAGPTAGPTRPSRTKN